MSVSRRGRVLLHDSVDSRVLVGKRVVTVGGVVIGKVKAVLLDPRELRVAGIVVATGVFAPDCFVDGHDIRGVREDEALVEVGVLDLVVGEAVFDVDGWWVGEISGVVRDEASGLVQGVRVMSGRGEVEVGVGSLVSCRDGCVLKGPFVG
jgi:sporulation protein YlmC with PRC-barrel domain